MTRLLLGGATAFLLLACGGDPQVYSGTGLNNRGGTSAAEGGAPDNGPGVDIVVDKGEGGSDSTAPVGVCGNGELEASELCDDGNTADADGCSADCLTPDPNFDCSVTGEPCVNFVICGSGQLEGDEACDDGNTDGGDGCAADCSATEEGFVCPRPGKDCVELSECGNGQRERGEACDDGQSPPADGDGCSALCETEGGFWCPAPGQACVALICGDGSRTPDEECDDNQTPPLSLDGCSSTCKVEAGWRCSTTGCSPICGDGVKTGGEECDDTNRLSGDGCSSACVVEPRFNCSGQPSLCASTIACGNNVVEPGELCDPPGVDGCLAGCKTFSPDVGAAASCGNSIIEAGEQCDPPMVGNGCSAGCGLEPGFSCPRPGVCFEVPACNDGILHAALGEECDDGDSGDADGCVDCLVVAPYTCYGLQPSVCIQEVCGNGVRTPSEQCDDGANGAGCTLCQIDTGWVCPVAGQKCVERCGDGVKVGAEQCDDGNAVPTNGDGCNVGCRIEPGFACPNVGVACTPSVCGNNITEGSEACDDNNTIAGDGCGPTCQQEPVVTVGPNPTVGVGCGDGLITNGEACDDGNTASGDGCEGDCSAEEPEFTCSTFVDYPASVQMKVTYRDFWKRTSTGGHPDFQWGYDNNSDANIPGPVCTSTTTECSGLPGAACGVGTCGHLDAQGKPVFRRANAESYITNPDTFSLWYRDTNPTSIAGLNGAIQISPIVSSITLNQVGGATSDVYDFDDTSFWPLTGLGFGNDGNGQNFHFTTELRYFFQYKGGETLSFVGDDDVWVFVNGRHAVDIGGVHGALRGRVILGDDGDGAATDSNCSVHLGGSLPACALEATELASNDDQRFGLVKGNVYEIVLFQAERHTTESNFHLTLAGFLAPRTFCDPKCGDGIVVAGEVCDDGAGNQNGVSGKCNTTCTGRAFCGDNQVQTGETCDNGQNLDLYRVGAATGKCAPSCVLPPRCGDNVVQAAFESCDRGASNNDLSYGSNSCTTSCELGAFCGDGTKNGAEVCDQGAANGVNYGPTSCGYDCKAGPFCGDKVRNGPEECDGSANCNANCTLDPYCGDGVTSAGEDCDHGQFASSAYGGCNDTCHWGPGCGDATEDTPQEECDLGTVLNTGSYDGCTDTCNEGPRCGDGVLQSVEGEACDNGFNDDTYLYTPSSCGPNCSAVPFCGDGLVEPGWELCDEGGANADDAYNGCDSKCEWGPYCGDGLKSTGELCDDGANNTGYAAGTGCGYDCKPAPYCGDGQRNGPEQCDDGTDANTGAYAGCNADCTRAAYCGDGEQQTAAGEECDDGPTGSLNCSTMCEKRSGVK